MMFSFLDIWSFKEGSKGFDILSFDFDREDEIVFSLFGIAWDEDEIYIDLFWKCFTFKRKNTQLN